jgi:hypothetical protein
VSQEMRQLLQTEQRKLAIQLKVTLHCALGLFLNVLVLTLHFLARI